MSSSFLPLRRNSRTSPTADQPGYSILLNGNNPSSQSRPRSSSSASAISTSSSSSLPPTSASSSRPSLCAKVSFAPLPEVPPELKRRSSITLGVASRKNLLSNQGGTSMSGGAGRTAPRKANVVYMTDEEWEHYKKQYESKNE
jgi:hypothetical protein